MKNMEEEEHRHDDDDIVNTKVLEVIWRGKKLSVEIESRATTLKDFGDKLQKLTNIKSHTMRFLLPNKILMPFSHQHSNLTLQEETSILKAKSIRMMGVLEHEIEEVLQSNAKEDSRRIAGFDEEEKRLRQRMSDTTNQTKLPPQGNYIFSHFRTLHIPGLQLNPPASEALKRMHRLAADPGIIAIMNKHRWRVGIMTEMAPVGYVGISPKCILGFNKNHGEEISLRLRTDDLKGFRKYESIKKTLLHELAHMVHSEHDANFYALDKQLNEEAASLDWTRSRSHTLGGHGRLDHYEEFEEYYDGTGSNSAQKLGGKTSEQLASARASSVAAAYRRLVNVPENSLEGSEVHEEQDTGDSAMEVKIEVDKGIESEPNSGINGNRIISELDDVMTTYGTSPDEVVAEPDPDESMTTDMALNSGVVSEPDPDENNTIEHVMKGTEVRKSQPGPDEGNEINKGDSDSRGNVGVSIATSIMKADDLDIDDSEMRRIQDPVAEICTRLQNTIETLRSEVGDYAATVLQTLFKIIRNVIEHPNEMKFKRLRKANPHFQRNVANYKAAMEVLYLVGFNEDVVADEIGRVETYIVLKRNDPGLLWLAKSSLEMCIAH